MDVRFLEAADEIRERFIKQFILSWEEFQRQHRPLIAKRAKTRYPIDLQWYQDSYLWDKADPIFQSISFADALTFLQQQSGKVLFMSEQGKYTTKQIRDSVGEADARELAAEIKKEWLDSYTLSPGWYDPDAFLTDDLYVFDLSMQWCVIFTHETTLDDPDPEDIMQEAESRLCLIYKK
jgi:hypothetical protein